uniref:DNA repair and recombination protein RadA n=1 Tax=Promethearchaeum syntrophicum TaxID=2594042 RepID=A0A5B9DEL7_9ARCH|nr:DNA repair and recombination protein RadA [Candidatus Prometheoarchaeum syntrophicum]
MFYFRLYKSLSSNPSMELAELSSIKPRQIKLLQENGITDIKALSMSVPRDLEEIEGISGKASKKLIWDARDVMGMSAFKQVSQIEENYDFLTTGSKNFDEILNGGVSTGRLTEVFGAFKSGKTNLAHTLAVTCQMPINEGGLDGAVLYIDTENTFSKSKIERIARRFGFNPQKILGNIYHARIYSTDHQFQMIRAAEQACIDKNARLIVVDSLMALMRSEYVGIGMLASRQQVLNKMIHELSRIAETHNVAVLLTNQVATFMKGTYSANDAIGGNIVAHGCHFRIQFKTKGFSANTSLERSAIIVDAPDLPPEVASFFITEAGISDSEKVEYLFDEEEVKPLAKKTPSKKKKSSKKKAVASKSAELSDPLESL